MATLILVISFLTLSILKQLKWAISYQKVGRISMSAMLIFIGGSHFFIPENLMEMIPPAFPFPLFIVYLTGVIECLIAILLWFDQTYQMAGKVLIVYFILIWPANIYNAMIAGKIPGGFDEYIPFYHWVRVIIIQPFFIMWVFLSTGKSNSLKSEKGSKLSWY